MSIYLMEERQKARTSIIRLNDLAGEAKRSAERGLILPEATEKGIIQLTGASDRSRQVDALTSLADTLQKRHLDRLQPLARDDFNAFCEYVSPEEPPASAWHIWLTQKLQEIEFDPDLGRFILNCPPGHAKPLSVTTPVLMGDGSWKPLGDIVPGDQVISAHGIARHVTAVHDQGELPLLKITTERGRVIHAAADHPFLIGTADNPTWKNAEALRPGEALFVVGGPQRGLEDWSGQPADMFRLAAYMGACSRQVINRVPTGDPVPVSSMWFSTPNHANDAQAICERLDLKTRLAWIPANKRHLLTLWSQSARKIAPFIPLGVKTPDRRVPEWVFRGSDEKVAAFLSTFFRFRGKVLKEKKRPHVHVVVRGEGYARDIVRLLARLGVSADAGRTKQAAYQTVKIIGPHVETLIAAGVEFNGIGDPHFKAKRKSPILGALTDKVRSIEVAAPGACKCLTVDADASFVADGIAVHNSTYASRLFVAWRLGRNPNLKIIGGGHSQRFVENEFSAKIRNLVRSPEFGRVFPDLKLDYSTSAKDQWAVAGKTGQYAAKGVGQAVHGFRANFVCVDDPYAKIEEAESAVQREKVNTWFTGDLGSRMLPFGKMFLIMTRFHEEDLTGHLMEMNKRLPEYAQWHQTEAPALCIDPETDVLGRKLGEVLWDYYDLSYFVTKQTEFSFQRFSLVYQQNPSATSSSNVSGSFQYYDHAPHMTPEAIKKARENDQLDENGRIKPSRREYFRKIILSVDTAGKTTERADYTVIQTWGETHDRKYYLLRQTRLKAEFNAMIEAIEKQARKDEVDAILVEDKGQGTAYIQARGRTEFQRRLAPAPIIPIDPKGQSKEFRFDEITPMITEGSVYLPSKAPWLDAFIKEVGQFPDGAHDDQVDSMSQALRYFKVNRAKFGSKKIGSFG